MSRRVKSLIALAVIIVFLAWALANRARADGQGLVTLELPTQRTDGAALPIGEIGAVTTAWGFCPTANLSSLTIPGAVTSILVTGLPPGEICFAASVTDTAGLTSELSFPPASKTIPLPPDADGDGMEDDMDNCLVVANPTQVDSDLDGYGNRCDGDFDNNGFTNAFDTTILRSQIGMPSAGPVYNEADINANGAVNSQDTTLHRAMIGYPPGPSGLRW